MRTSAGVLGLVLAAIAARQAEACSATSVVDRARQAGESDAYRMATDVAKEVLDREGLRDQDVSKTLTDSSLGDITATPIEAGACVLLVEAGAKGIGVTQVVEDYGRVTTQTDSVDDLRGILDLPAHYNSTGIGKHADTVREHMLLHARDYGAVSAAPVQASAPVAAPESEPTTVEQPVSSPAPAAPSAVEEEPVPAVDHAG